MSDFEESDDGARVALVILGRTIGTYESWDEGDVGVIGFASYEPNALFADVLPPGYLNADFNNGELQFMNDDGKAVFTVDMIALLRDVPRDDGQTPGDEPLTAEDQDKIDAAWEKHKAAKPVDEWPDITAADVRKAHGFPDPILQAIDDAGLKVAFDIPAGASWNEAVQAMVGDKPSPVVEPLTPTGGWPSERAEQTEERAKEILSWGKPSE